ncbi:MAG: YggS family pyridoxal phosphate-dependent enzyme [Candidatus Acidiferrales bacterium]
MPIDASALESSLASVRGRIVRAAARSRRAADEITLIAVTKTLPHETIRAAYTAGLREFGENRVQERETKEPHIADVAATWHLIGHLQSNKARRAAALFDSVDSLDSLALAKKLDAAAAELSKRIRVLIEVRVDFAAAKSGIAEEELPDLATQVLALPHLDLRGLMTVPPLFGDPERVRPFFRRLRELRDELSRRLARPLPELSMGMSHDFEVAIEEGATEIRLGSALFGPRSL